VLIELFSLLLWLMRYTSEYRLKIGVFARTGSVWLKILGTRGCPHQPFFVSEN